MVAGDRGTNSRILTHLHGGFVSGADDGNPHATRDEFDPGQGHGPPSHAAVSTDGVSVVASPEDHGQVPDGVRYGDPANIVDTVTLTDGEWMITASGAVTLNGDATALNCGLVSGDGTLLAKQNSAMGSETGRVGFAVTGGVIVEGELDIHLVCYGGGTSGNPGQPFEHYLVAIGG